MTFPWTAQNGKKRSEANMKGDRISEQSEPLMTDDTEASSRFQPPSTTKRFRFWCWIMLLSGGTVVFMLATAAVAISVAPATSQQHGNREPILYTQQNSTTMIQPCGQTPSEARARGCHFDVISFCWLPHECYDAELSEEYRKTNTLEWFIDPDQQIPLSYDEIMSGEHTGLYVNWEYHITHCTAMWKKIHRAILGDLGSRAIDSYIGRYAHTKHCEQMLLGGREYALEAINTRIAVKYPDCGI
ncbi:hypothetical protein H2198_002534 [Neophaeococcomyces mojaviensis]|uniref:Uncharacterized protein n=1 Tax=Neophaeococcomyces mojaviensis TaxID=3383035 RepID=A0ACC3AEP8_9EURO|nr:hypothetical protein H2198_002534 [Knufia sp. JES_112]